MIDLTGGSAEVIGNEGDEHLFRVTNRAGEQIIEIGAEFSVEFVSSGGTSTEVEADISEIDTGFLTFPVTINNGVYKVRRLNPVRTILTVKVDAK